MTDIDDAQLTPDDDQQIAGRTCPRCGELIERKVKGRPPIWCSQRCRRAAYEERRAASSGAIAIEVIERMEVTEHPLDTCVERCKASSVGSRRIVLELTRLSREAELQTHPRWRSTYDAVLRLTDEVNLRRSRGW